MATTTSIFHALLRPSILQILRATGYHSTRPAVLDSVTDLAARYLSLLCQTTAAHSLHNRGDAADFDVSDVRAALQDVGALQPERSLVEQLAKGGEEEEDVRGVEEFVKWFAGQRMREMMDIGSGDGESDATDYLNALKKKHDKTGEDAKYHGTILGRGADDTGEVQVEGGPETSIAEWIDRRSTADEADPAATTTEKNLKDASGGQQKPQQNGHPTLDDDDDDDSGLSSVGDRLDHEEMDLS